MPLTLWYQYVSPKRRAAGDVRDEFPQKHFLTTSFQFPLGRASATLFVRDVLDEGYEKSSPANMFPADVSYGRIIGLQLSYSF